jgi:hypothetical protein
MYGAPMMMQPQPMMAPMMMQPQPMMAPMMMQPQPMMAPMMMQPQPMMPMYSPPPPPPPPPQQQTIIITGNNNNDDNGNTTPCPSCGKGTGNIPRKKVGMVAIIWCLILSSCMLCYIPLCCSDSCKDI